MNFLLDENFPGNAWNPLTKLFRQHNFMQVGKCAISTSTGDISVFQQAADLGINAIITGDLKQIKIPGERTACREAGIHWIGVPRHPKARGKSVANGQVSLLYANLHQIVDYLEGRDSPQTLLLVAYPYPTRYMDGYPQTL